MKRFQWRISILLLILAQCAFADSVPTFITQANMPISTNFGGDNMTFTFSGPGVGMFGGGDASGCDWCFVGQFSNIPGSSVTPDIGLIRACHSKPDYWTGRDGAAFQSGDTSRKVRTHLRLSACPELPCLLRVFARVLRDDSRTGYAGLDGVGLSWHSWCCPEETQPQALSKLGHYPALPNLA